MSPDQQSHGSISLDLLGGLGEYLAYSRQGGNGELRIQDTPVTSLTCAMEHINRMSETQRAQLAARLTGLLGQHGSYAVTETWDPPL